MGDKRDCRSFTERLNEAVDEGAWHEVRDLFQNLGARALSGLSEQTWELILDIFFWRKACENFSSPNPTKDLVERKVRKLLSVPPRFLERKSYPLASVLRLGNPMPEPFRRRDSRQTWKKHVRHLRRQVLERNGSRQTPMPSEHKGMETQNYVTLRDLAFLWSPGFQFKRLNFRQGRFLHVGRLLKAPEPFHFPTSRRLRWSEGNSKRSFEDADPALTLKDDHVAVRPVPGKDLEEHGSLWKGSSLREPRNVVWGVLGWRGNRFLARLVEATAEEWRRVRDLAFSLSRARRRVVLSLHNASAAACSGWAFDPVDVLHDDPRHSNAFVREVSGSLQRLGRNRHDDLKACPRTRKGSGFWRSASLRAAIYEGRTPAVPSENPFSDGSLDVDLVQKLWRAWERRLVYPKALHVLWEASARTALGFEMLFQEAVQALDGLLEFRSPSDLVGKIPLAWSGWVSPHQQLCWQDISCWWREKRRLWLPGFSILKTCLEKGQAWLETGRLEACVVPWIDKFFMSSQRDRDASYLALFMEWLHKEDLSPIVLLWEDTTRCRHPSLAVALERSWSPEAFQGIGVFGNGACSRRNAKTFLMREAEPKRLYVLRPFDDTHAPQTLESVLSGRVSEKTFFDSYDSSWKDGTYALYAGTQAAFLTSIATDAEILPAWVVFEGVKMPLGCFFRRILRSLVLGRPHGTLFQPKWMRLYARFANLL
ncbi:MAG: hypothetical protein WHS46_02325 [Desulfosoma sp.]